MRKNKCCGCKEYFDKKSMFNLNGSNFCTIACASQLGYKRQLRAAKTRAKKELAATKSKHRADKEKIKSKAKWKAEAQAAFNKYIRARDYSAPCISCGRSKQEIESDQGWKVGGCWDAGHYKSRGAKGQLRFTLFNCHKQCKSCNGGSGKFSKKEATVSKQYRVNLIEKIGIKKVEWLDHNNDLEWFENDIEYFKRIKKIFSKKTRHYLSRIN